jgi:hypothetical protein
MRIIVSVDKIIAEFQDIRITDFRKFYLQLRNYSGFKDQRFKGYLFNFSIYSGEECMFFSYANYYERTDVEGVPQKPLYTLRLETSPINYIRHNEIIEMIKSISEKMYFVSADVAYDIPLPLENIIVLSKNNNRKMKIRKEDGITRYFGKGYQRKTDSYCRIYDKAEQLRTEKGIEVEGELSRIEIVYKPDSRIKFDEISIIPPLQGDKFLGKIIDDLSWCNAKRRQQILNMQVGKGKYSPHIRREIKKILATQVDINFNQLASEEWSNIMSVPVNTLLIDYAV